MKIYTNKNTNKLTILANLVLLALLVLSVIFYRERALFTDIAYQTFLMINDGGLQVQVYRFGSAIVQVLPLIALKLGAPLWSISMAYSISFPLLYLFFFWLIVRVLKNEYLGWALVFLFTLTVYDGFYWPSSEQQQGLAFLLVFWAFVLRFPKLDRWWMWLFVAIGIIALAFYHPLIFVPFLFLWGYFGWQEQSLRHRQFFGLALFMGLVLILKSQLADNWYDTDKYSTFFTNLTNDFPNYFNYPSHKKFLQNSLYYWYGFPIALLALTVFYGFTRAPRTDVVRKKGAKDDYQERTRLPLEHSFNTKNIEAAEPSNQHLNKSTNQHPNTPTPQQKWPLQIWVWAFVIGHVMLIHIGSPNSPYRFYSEVNYLPLTIYVSVPLLMEWAKPRWHQPIVFYLFLGIVVLRLLTIGLHHQPFTERLNWIEEKMEEGTASTNNYFLPRSKTSPDILIMDWAVAYESLLLSSIEHPDSAKTLLVLPDAGKYPNLFQSDTTFFSGIKKHDLKKLNSEYFRLRINKYEVLE